MLKRWNRLETWIALIVVGAGTLAAAVLGLHWFMTGTATPLHPQADRVPSLTDDDPAPQWAPAVERGRQILRSGLAEQNLPGLSVAVGVDREIVWAEGFGFADLDKRVPVAPNHRFRIGTASVVLTSAAAGLLIERERLQLDDEIQAYVPAFPKKQWPVTVQQVMSQVAGLRNDGGDEGPLLGEHCERPIDGLRAFADRSLLFEPGTQYRYSSYGWILMSAAIEAAAHEPFLTFMRKEIFEPLQMDDTRPDSAIDSIADRVTPYFPRYAAQPRYGPEPMRDLDYSCYAGASVFLSTPSDLVRFGLGIANGQLLQPDTVRLLQTSQRLTSGQETGYGLGWDLEDVTLLGKPTRAAGHDGDVLGGMTGSFWTFPNGIVVAVLSNTSYAGTFALASKVADVFAEFAAAPAPPR